MNLILEEFELLASCPTSKMIQQYRIMLSTVDKMIGAISEGTGEDERKEVKILLQKELTDGRLRSKSTLLAIDVKQGHEAEVGCSKMDPPHILIVCLESGVHQGWVLVDKTSISCTKGQGILNVTCLLCMREYFECMHMNELFFAIKFVFSSSSVSLLSMTA